MEIAIREAERLSGSPLADTLVDPATGEITPIRLFTDNGPASSSTDTRPDGETLAQLADAYREVLNRIRPHHAIGMHRPGDCRLDNLNQNSQHQFPDAIQMRSHTGFARARRRCIASVRRLGASS